MAKTSMGTVDKALALLRHFSVQSPELGLSELARRAAYDKTTTLRCLTALERNGFVEQDPESRKYRLGLAPINLAQIREQSAPVRAVFQRALDDLARALGETAHGTLLMGAQLLPVGISTPDRALFVHFDPSETLPWHATASGIAVAAFQPVAVQQSFLAAADGFEAYTRSTPIDRAAVAAWIAACRRDGVARAEATFEDDVIGTAAPVFGPAGLSIGAVAVAAVALRFTPDHDQRITAAVKAAARTITRDLGGVIPDAPPAAKDLAHAAH